MAITWNVVNKTDRPLEPVKKLLQDSIARLEKLLSHFPEDALHLQIVLSPQRKDKSHPVTLNLRVPSDVLQVRKEAPSVERAVKDAVASLAGRLERLKSRYRRDHAWKGRRAAAMPERAAAFMDGPLPDDANPRTFDDLVTRVLQDNYQRLVSFVGCQLHEYILSGAVPRDAIEAKDVVHRVVEKALTDRDLKPKSMDYYTWCTSLAFQQTRDAVRRFVEEEDREVPVDLEANLDLREVAQEGVEPEEFALNLLRQHLEPDETTLADTIPDPHAEAPDLRLFEHEVVNGMRKMARSWPTFERQVFEMHFLEGMSADDLATTFDCDRAKVERAVGMIRARLRTRLTAAAMGLDGDAGSAAAPPEPDSKNAAAKARAEADLDPGRTRHRDDAATRTRSELDALLIAMRRLESSLASAAPYRLQAWARRVRDDFRAVRSALRQHGESAASEDGLLAEIRRARPELESRISDLIRRQREMMDLAARLEEAIVHNGKTPDFTLIRRQAADLLLMIRHQHAQEADLIYEAFWQDIGGSE